MMELLVTELLVVGTWIAFVAYGAWFFSSAKKRERDQEEVQEGFSGLYKSRAQRISRRVSASEQVRKSIPKPPKRLETVRAHAGSGYSFANGLAIGFGLTLLAAFIILWMSIFYASQLSAGINYEKMISVLIYPMLFTFATGTALLTTGIVRRAQPYAQP